MPEALLESELFGHVRGAFTGADKDKKGLIEAADGGTVFLDEIGEMPPTMQVKLLRVLQERKYRRVGGTEESPSNIRVIAATNRDLPKLVGEGKFREDLFYRLNVIPVKMPALRDRAEDIPLIAEHFLAKYTREMNKTIDGFSPEALAALARVSLARQRSRARKRRRARGGARIRAPRRGGDAAGEPARRPAGDAAADHGEPIAEAGDGFNLERHLQDIERSHLERALERAGGVQTRAADVLGLSFRQFRYLMKKHALKRDVTRAALAAIWRRDRRNLRAAARADKNLTRQTLTGTVSFSRCIPGQSANHNATFLAITSLASNHLARLRATRPQKCVLTVAVRPGRPRPPDHDGGVAP